MANIALFHSVLGVRPGITEAAQRLRTAGHVVHVVDQYDGKVFDDYEAAGELAASIGYPALMQRALEAVADLPDGFIAMGFSNGGGMAEFVGTQRACSGVVMASGALPLEMIGVTAWPAGVPAQIHYAVGDPMRRQDWVDAVLASVREAGAGADSFEYPGHGHLFTDPSLPEEYDEHSAELFWDRVLDFCDATSRRAERSDTGSVRRPLMGASPWSDSNPHRSGRFPPGARRHHSPDRANCTF
ncbi:MAG: dienelactone hydrolase [Actinomycetia bacterium]|nr:dienelactone hydrolase [Actinomycetes bacterium]